MADGNFQCDENDLERFRRWIMMTRDGKYREFRGTPGMVNIGQGRDLVELVDRMMLARIAHYGNMHKGWKLMRAGLTPCNADWIYSEMMASIESLLKFETENFSPSNSWTIPKQRREFPPYLSDDPVLDGQTVPQYSDIDEKLKQICGEALSNRLIELFEEANAEFENQENYFEGTSEQFLALGRIQGRFASDQMPPLERSMGRTQDGSTQTEVPGAPSLSANKLCSGVGISFNANGEPTVTVMCNDGQSRAVTPTPLAQLPRRSTEHIPSLMSLNRVSSGSQGNSQANVMALVITQTTSGDITSVGYAPMYSQQSLPAFTSAPTQLAVPRPAEVLDLTSTTTATTTNEERTRNNRPCRHRSVAQRPQPGITISNSTQLSNNSDSGFSSTSDQGNVSTRASTPATATQQAEALSPSTTNITEESQVETKEAIVPTIELPQEIPDAVSVTTPITEQVPEPIPIVSKPSGPSYASIVSKQASSPTSSGSMSTSDRNITSWALGASSSSRVVMKDNLRVGDGDEMTKNDVSIGNSSTRNEWIQVKTKNALVQQATEVQVAPTQTKPVKEERPVMVSEVAETWDTLELDDEREMEQERKRLKKQKQRAAKVQRQKEERRMRTENGAANGDPDIEDSTVEEAELNGEQFPIDSVQIPNDIQTLEVINQEIPTTPQKLVIDSPVYKPVLAIAAYYDETGRLCDDEVIKEPEGHTLSEEASSKMILHARVKEHSKIVFRMLWFDNKKKIHKLQISEEARKALQERLNVLRTMKERIDMAGRIIVYRISTANHISASREENLIEITKNLIDMKRCNFENDMEMAKAFGNVVGKLTKDFTYLNYVFAILSLPEDFIVKFKANDSRISQYKHIEILTQLHVKRVQMLYDELCGLYRFNIVKIPESGRK